MIHQDFECVQSITCVRQATSKTDAHLLIRLRRANGFVKADLYS